MIDVSFAGPETIRPTIALEHTRKSLLADEESEWSEDWSTDWIQEQQIGESEVRRLVVYDSYDWSSDWLWYEDSSTAGASHQVAW